MVSDHGLGRGPDHGVGVDPETVNNCPHRSGRVERPITSFEAKNWLEVNFPRRGKSYIFPQATKSPFSQNLHFMGKLAILRERESYFQRKLIPQREIVPLSVGKFAQFSLGGKILPQKMFRGGTRKAKD